MTAVSEYVVDFSPRHVHTHIPGVIILRTILSIISLRKIYLNSFPSMLGFGKLILPYPEHSEMFGLTMAI